MKTTLYQISKSLFTLFVLLAMAGVAIPQDGVSLLTSANGKGTITVGHEEFRLHSVIIKLLEDGKTEITLVSDITFFLQGTWSKSANAPGEVDLKITGTTAGGGVQGDGKVLLRDDRKSLAGVTLQGSSNTRKRLVKVNFKAN